MRDVVVAIVAATNFITLVHEETMSLEVRRAADKTLEKLHAATDKIIQLREKEKEHGSN